MNDDIQGSRVGETGGIPIDPRTPVVSAQDDAARLLVQKRIDSELSRAQARADKWITGLGAIVGVLTTAVVIAGPESLADLGSLTVGAWTPKARDVAITLMIAGGVLLALGIFFAYKAAVGDPIGKDFDTELADSELKGLAEKWRLSVQREITNSRAALRHATQATIIGGIALAAAILVSWFAAPASSEKSATCIKDNNGNLVKLEGSLPAVVSGSITVVGCS